MGLPRSTEKLSCGRSKRRRPNCQDRQLNSESGRNMLDDKDEFESLHWAGGARFRFMGLWVPLDISGSLGFPTKRDPEPDYFKHLTMEKLEEQKRRMPLLFKHQEEALRAFGVREPLSECLRALGGGRKGQPYKRETPLLKNPPRTTPETVKYLLNRQRSSV